jgi:uncharacterized membrane protein YqjE
MPKPKAASKWGLEWAVDKLAVFTLGISIISQWILLLITLDPKYLLTAAALSGTFLYVRKKS